MTLELFVTSAADRHAGVGFGVAMESVSAGAPQALSETMVRTLGQPRGGAWSVPIRDAVLRPAELVPRARRYREVSGTGLKPFTLSCPDR